MALTSAALTTLALVKDDLGISGSTYDTRLEDLIEISSQQIATYLGRKLHYQATIAEAHEGYGYAFIVVRVTPLWSIASITVDGGTVSADDYEIHDAYSGEIRGIGSTPMLFRSTAQHLTGTVTQPILNGTESKEFTVTYAGGWQTPGQAPVSGVDALPRDIGLACRKLVATHNADRGRSFNVASESLLSHSITYGGSASTDLAFATGGMPLQIAEMLTPYRHWEQST